MRIVVCVIAVNGKTAYSATFGEIKVFDVGNKMARDEREDFAAFLESLSPDQWEAPTLCERWNVREVAAHAIRFDELNGGELVRRFLKGWLMVDRINQVGVDDYADRTPRRLIELIRTHAQPHGLTAGFGGRTALTDNMIHQQDIRRALDLPRTIPAERLRVARWTSLGIPRRSAEHGGRAVCGSRHRPRLVAWQWPTGRGQRRGGFDGDSRAAVTRSRSSPAPGRPGSQRMG